MTGQSVNLALNLISISLAARYLGVESFGKFSALLAITTFISKLFDFGLPSVVFRELSLRHTDYKFLNSAIFITIISYLVTGVTLNVLIMIFNTSFTEVLLLNLLLFNTLLSAKFNNMRDLLNAPFKVSLRMNIPMMIVVLDNIIFLIIILFMPVFKGGLRYFIFGYVFSNLPGFLIMFIFLVKKFNFRLKFNLSGAKWLFKEALPLYGYLILDSLFQLLDIILIKYFHGNYDVGIYSVSVRLVAPLLVIPYAVIQTIFPRIVQNLNSLNSPNENIIITVYKILFGFAATMSILFTFKSQEIVTLLFGINYQNSSISTSILFWSQIFIYYSYFTINLFLAYHKQSLIFKYAVVILVINILLNLILIPQTSFIGASVAKMVAALLGSVYIMAMHFKLKKKLYFLNVRILVWSTIILIFCFLSSNLPLVPYFIISPLLIFSSMIFIQYFTKDEVVLFFKLINKPQMAGYLLKFY